MKVYRISRKQKLPISLDEAWSFFSTPRNLQAITPEDLHFEILGDVEEHMYAGQLIGYKVSPFPGFKVGWLTEITHCEARCYFVDEQRSGPFRLWHHKHFFHAANDGVLMEDIVDYAIPLGPLGTLAHALFVKKRVEEIFNFRYRKLEQLFATGQEQVVAT